MSRFSSHRRLLLQLLVVLFGMNASLGYGACCDEMASGGGGLAEIELMAEEAEVLPCHQPAADDSASADFKTCCASCVSALPSLAVASAKLVLGSAEYLAPFSYYGFSNIQTPYRPPSISLA